MIKKPGRIVFAGIAFVMCLSAAVEGSLAQSPPKPIDAISEVPRRARLALFTAYEAREEGDYKRSTEILLDFVEDHPDEDHFVLRYQLGNSMAHTHTPKEQLEQYERCVELEPRYAKGWMSVGEVAYNVGDYRLAAEALAKGFRLNNEKKPQVLYYAAAAYVMAEEPEQAIPLLEELVGGKWGPPQMEWYKALVSAALQTEDGERGERAINSLIGNFGNDPEAWKLAFQYAAGTSDYRQAAVALKIKGYLEPLTREERIQLGDLFVAVGVPREASDSYAAAMRDSADTKELERLASAYLAAHDTETALRTLNRALEQEPTARLWSLYGDLNFMDKDYEEAYRAYEQSAEMDPEDGRAFLMMAYCAMEIGDKKDAVMQLELASNFPEQQSKAREILSKIDVYLP